MKSKRWKKMQPAVLRPNGNPHSEHTIKIAMEYYDIDSEAAVKMMTRDENECCYWLNDLYQVEQRDAGMPGWTHLNIRRRDGGVIVRDWRHFQQIKNDIVGPECEGFEMFPAESRKVDTANKYHLFVCTDPEYRFPFGWSERLVQYDDGPTAGTRQRRIEPQMDAEDAWNSGRRVSS